MPGRSSPSARADGPRCQGQIIMSELPPLALSFSKSTIYATCRQILGDRAACLLGWRCVGGGSRSRCRPAVFVFRFVPRPIRAAAVAIKAIHSTAANLAGRPCARGQGRAWSPWTSWPPIHAGVRVRTSPRTSKFQTPAHRKSRTLPGSWELRRAFLLSYHSSRQIRSTI
jgi:hypothetical protein